MMEVEFTPLANIQLEEWKKVDFKIYSRIENLIDSIQKNPYTGIGKPEPLKYQLQGFWSRRITKHHRLVYKVSSNSIIIVACKYHY